MQTSVFDNSVVRVGDHVAGYLRDASGRHPGPKSSDMKSRKYIKMGIIIAIILLVVRIKVLAPIISVLAGAWVAHEHKSLVMLGVMTLVCTSTSATVEWSGSKKFNLFIHVMTSVVFMMYSPFVGAMTMAYPITSAISIYQDHKLEEKMRAHLRSNVPNVSDLDEEPEYCDDYDETASGKKDR